jgi:hypothetical protein
MDALDKNRRSADGSYAGALQYLPLYKIPRGVLLMNNLTKVRMKALICLTDRP